MNWFDADDEVVIRPETDRARFWMRRFGQESVPVARKVLFANNGHGRLFEAACQDLDACGSPELDHRQNGYCHYRLPVGEVTVYRAPEPAPYAAHALEHLLSAGARQVIFLNGAGSLREDLPPGSLLLPGKLVREEGTSFHYAPPETALQTDHELNNLLAQAAASLGAALTPGGHWTTDAIYRETRGKVQRYRQAGVHSVDMELSALAGAAYFRGAALSALLVVTDVLCDAHTWDGLQSAAFEAGARLAAQVAVQALLLAGDDR